jgi:hypothetical protein
MEDCLTRYPDHRDELEPLLQLVLRLQGVRTLKAPREFRLASAVRMQHLATARQRRVQRTAKDPNALHRAWGRLRAILRIGVRSPATALLSILVAMVLMGAGAAYASADTLPGDVLYPLKTTIEDARLRVSLSDERNADLRLAFAGRRLDEARALLDGSRPGDIDGVLSDYDGQLASISALLAEDSSLQPGERVAVAARLAGDLADHHEAQLNTLLERAGQDERPAVERAVQAYRKALDRALDVANVKPEQAQPGLIDTPTPTPTPRLSSPLPTPTLSPRPPRATRSPMPPERRTRVPTALPTGVPTGWPTGAPEGGPKPAPTAWPTEAPEHWPTWVPTAWPTWLPTAWPTGVPKHWPTEVPKQWPTWVPKAWPTRQPRSDRWRRWTP